MKLILVIAYLVCLIFAPLCGKPFQWFFEICASNAYASILLFGFLALGFVRLINYFTGEFNLNSTSHYKRYKTTQTKTHRE